MKPAVFLCLFLTACGTIYQPEVVGIPANPKQFGMDVAFCQQGATAYAPSLSAGDIAAGAVSGAAQNITGTAISPLVPALGAAGGATSALASGLDVMGQARGRVFKHCLQELTRRDQSAVVADPD